MANIQCFDCGHIFGSHEGQCSVCGCKEVEECPECGSEDVAEFRQRENLDVLFPEVCVRLTGADGNAFSIMGKVSGALRRHGVPKEKIDEYTKESMSGDYDHLLRTAMKWVDVS